MPWQFTSLARASKIQCRSVTMFLKINTIKSASYRLSSIALGGMILSLLLSGCGGNVSSKGGKYYADDGPPADYKENHIKPDAVPKVEPKSRGGNPDSCLLYTSDAADDSVLV